MLGLYIHVPFCASLCPYCTFTRGPFDEALAARYVDAVVSEIEAAPSAGDGSCDPTVRPQADTVYFGGGTPSLLTPEAVARILDACRRRFAVDPAAEITLEGNPESVTPSRLAGYRAAGVNRLSLGIQSFRDAELGRLGRVHDARQAYRAVAESREAGFNNLSLDLMLWLPGQTLSDLAESVEALVAAGPEHASLYLLELYPSSPFGQAAAEAGWHRAPDDEAADMYLFAMARLESAGFQQYEISNLTRPGRESRHNLKYWTGGDWIGFGPAAHSTWGGHRWNNVGGTEEYLARVFRGTAAHEGRRALGPQEQLEEALFMGLRLARGVDLAWIRRRFGVDVWAEYGYRLSPCFDAGLLASETGRLRLTREGMLLANEVMRVFVEAPRTKPWLIT